MQSLCVIGSMNVDLTVRIPRFHAPGESLVGDHFATYTGGKGGNQATAAAKLGAQVWMVGRLGTDENGMLYRSHLERVGAHVDGVVNDPDITTGVALIEVIPSGENRIAVVPGANMRLDIAQIDRLWPVISACDIFLLQLEIPMPTIEYAIQKLHAAGKTIILDPAPATKLTPELLRCVDYLTPNETELALLSGMPAETTEDAITAAKKLLAMGTRIVIAKRGRHGALLVTAEEATPMDEFKVQAVDTTAAGDSFNAGLAVALANGYPLPQAIRFANAIGALSTTAHGAQGAMPTMAEAEAFLQAHIDE